MTSNEIFPNFPYSAESEPRLSWTVEETLQRVLLKSHESTDLKHEELVVSLKNMFEQGKKELWDIHARIHENQENICENGGTSIDNKQTTTTSSSNKIKTIHVEITEGLYQGKEYKLIPKPNAPCMVGRSTGRKYRYGGISLAKDIEVSTTHGKFEILSGKAYYIDAGSTNGSHHKGVPLEQNCPHLLLEGMELAIGESIVRIVSLSTT